MSEDVLHNLDSNGVLRVTINRPERMNALTVATLEQLTDLFAAQAKNDAVRTVILAGTGRAFCTGADLSSGMAQSDVVGSTTLAAANAAVAAIRNFPTPVIAAVSGPAAGVGVSLALATDLVVASESSYFLLAFANIGLMPDGGATALVAASIGRARAMRMALLAERMPAHQAFEFGLISEVVSDASFDARIDEISEKFAHGPKAAYQRTKHAINEATLTNLDRAFALETEGQVELLFGTEFREGALAFSEKRKPNFRKTG